MSINETLNERQGTHGEFSENVRVIRQFEMIAKGEKGYKRLSPIQQEVFHMIFIKMARILTGDPNHIDDWHDISGYSTLAERELSTPTPPQND